MTRLRKRKAPAGIQEGEWEWRDGWWHPDHAACGVPGDWPAPARVNSGLTAEQVRIMKETVIADTIERRDPATKRLVKDPDYAHADYTYKFSRLNPDDAHPLPPPIPSPRRDGHDQQRDQQKQRKEKSTPFSGVTRPNRSGTSSTCDKYESQIWWKGSQQQLGSHPNAEILARSYDKSVIVLCPKDNTLNFNPDEYNIPYLLKYRQLKFNDYVALLKAEEKNDMYMIGLKLGSFEGERPNQEKIDKFKNEILEKQGIQIDFYGEE